MVEGILLGVVISYFVSVICEMINKSAGDDCDGDCGKCTARCVGYHCYLKRLEAEYGDGLEMYYDDVDDSDEGDSHAE